MKKETKIKDEFLVFGKPDISDIEINAVVDVLKSGWLSTGNVTRQFESEFQKFIGDGYTVPVSSCTMGLMLSLIVNNVGQDSEVIVPAITFCATANAVIAVGAKPIFCDVLANGLIDVDDAHKKLTQKTKAIIPVHYTGASADMNKVHDFASQHHLKVIEDAAHAFDGFYVEQMKDNKPGIRHRIGTVSDFTCFSFYATKNITCGEGGMVVTKNAELAERMRILSLNGLSADAWRRYGTGPIANYEVAHAGHKGNLSDVHAAIGLAQLRRWPVLRTKRETIWDAYESAFGLKEPGHAKHLFTIKHRDRDALRTYLHSKGIGTGVHFKALHLEPAYAFLRHKKGDLPRAENIGATTVSLPLSSTMTVKDAERVIKAIKDFDSTWGGEK